MSIAAVEHMSGNELVEALLTHISPLHGVPLPSYVSMFIIPENPWDKITYPPVENTFQEIYELGRKSQGSPVP